MIKEKTAPAITDLQETNLKAPQQGEDIQKSSAKGGQELLPAAAFTTFFTWTANGVHPNVNFALSSIRANSRVLVNISEFSGTATNRFIGGAKMAVYNIAPYNGGFKAWVEISWGSPLTVRFDVFVDP